MPRLSVLMTVYNGMPYLPPAIESVLQQSFRDFEFIIVDDGSTDETANYLNSLSDERIKIIRRENGGTAAAANQGLALCQGTYVARMDADDISLPNRFEKQVQYLDQHPDVGLLGAQVAPLGDRGVGKSLCLPTTHEEICRALNEGRHALAHSAIMMRTETLKNIGGYWRYRLVDDWDMMLRMSEVSRVANLPDLLHHYRIHRGSLNGKQMKSMRFSIDYACECARRRRESLPAISPDEFRHSRERRSAWVRTTESIDVWSRCHYRLAMAEILGGYPVIGYSRMALAALMNPTLTLQRLGRWVKR